MRKLRLRGIPGVSRICQPMQETKQTIPASGLQEASLEEGMAIHSSILTWRISWTEDPGGLQSKGLQRIEHN